MPRLKIAPTRSNLLRTKESLRLAKDGYELLEQKREVLLMELMQIVHDLRELEDQIVQKSEVAFKALDNAFVAVGSEAVKWSALSVSRERDVELVYRSVMGVPIVTMQESKDKKPTFSASMEGTSPAIDEAQKKFEELISAAVRWSEVEISVWRLASEIKKTQRRVNALENIFIPEYKATVKAIEEVLEESDREEFIRKKKVKAFLERKKKGL